MSNMHPEVIDLVQRIRQLPGGITPADFGDLTIITARGFEPRAFGRLKARTERRELRESLIDHTFADPAPMQGNIIMGSNATGITRYDSRYSPMHLCGIGSTGSGKTVFLIFLLISYLLVAQGLWLFDFAKRSLRGFLRIAAQYGRKAIVCRHEFDFNNPLDPEDLDPSNYVNICAEFLTISLNLPPVARHIFKICLTQLYEKCGLFNDPAAQPPIWEELIKQVRQFEGNKSAKDAILIRLEAMLTNKRHIYSVRRGVWIRDLEKLIVIWELDGLETEYQNMRAKQLICKLFARRVKFAPERLIVVALDEAIRIARRSESVAEGPSYIDTMISVVREKLISLKFFAQTAYGLSNSVIANSAIKVLFAAGSPHDYEIFGSSMSLDSQQIRYAKTTLTVGSQIVKMSFGHRLPFINYSPDIIIPQDVTDEEVRQSVQILLDLMPKPNVPSALPLCLPDSSVPNETKTNLTENEQAFIAQVKQHPEIISATEHCKMLGGGTKAMIATKQSLVSKGLIKETPLESGRRGRKSLYLEVVEENQQGRLGGNLHRYLRIKVEEYYHSRGASVVIEKSYFLNGICVYVDVVVMWPDGIAEAVEIETQASEHAIQNIHKCLAIKECLGSGFATIHVVTPNRDIRRGIQCRLEKVADVDMSRIKFSPMSFFDK